MQRWRGLCLALGSLIIFTTILEIALRTAGLLISAPRARVQALTFSPDEFRIVCLGDSYTFGAGADNGHSYPSQLGKILKARHPSLKIRVINQGLPGATSSLVLQKIDATIDAYRPAVIVLLVGINDRYNFKDLNLDCLDRREIPWQTRLEISLSRLRVYKLFRFAISAAAHAHGLDQMGKVHDEDPRRLKFRRLVLQANDYFSRREFSKAVPLLTQMVHGGVADALTYSQLGIAYQNSGRSQDAKNALQTGIALFPGDSRLQQNLGSFLLSEHDANKALAPLRKAVEIDPDNEVAVAALFDAYLSANPKDPGIARILSRHAPYSFLLPAMGEDPGLYGREEMARMAFFYNMRRIARQARARNIGLIVGTYPEGQMYKRELLSVCSENKVELLDIRPAFDRLFAQGVRREDLLIPDGHCNARGYGVMAQAFAQSVDRYIAAWMSDYAPRLADSLAK